MKWKQILKQVDKDQIPLNYILNIQVNLIDGTTVNLDIKALLQAGADPVELKAHIDNKLSLIDEMVADIDFHINIDDVAKTVQTLTDHMLKDL